MKTALITPTPPDVAAFGVRALSAYLKREGKKVRNIFLPGGIKKNKNKKDYIYQYERHIIEETIELCKECDLIGISFMTNYFDRAKQLTQEIRKCIDAPVIWGGIHPTVAPEESMQHVEMVCIGEGEEALLELVQKLEEGKDYFDTRNIWFKKDGKIIKNQLRPLIQDLDSLPYFDFSLDDHYIYDHTINSIAPMTKDLLKKCFPLEPNVEGSFSDSYKRTVSYKTMTTRGCPHHCTFCAERALAEMYPGEMYLRSRSVGHVIKELEHIKEHLSFIESIFLFDDTFTARPLEEIIEFSKEYKEKIKLPFHIQTSPLTLNKEKMDAMIEGGLVFVEMGIQTLSKTGMKIYKRGISRDVLLKKASLLKEYSNSIYPPCYHIILDNPWETTDDVIETLRLILELPRPFWLKRASLICFPGTELYVKSKAEGIIKTQDDERREIYNKHLHVPQGKYANFLVYLSGFSYFPRWILRVMSASLFVFIFDRKVFSTIYTLLQMGGEQAIILSKGIRALFTGDFKRIYKFLVRWYT
ncbi:MAG: radical SAM protein [Thermodesulfobacteriota bacterium]|nr:radical SAM protein [Thermodesulfobacteriota bacterium]